MIDTMNSSDKPRMKAWTAHVAVLSEDGKRPLVADGSECVRPVVLGVDEMVVILRTLACPELVEVHAVDAELDASAQML